MNKIPVFIDCDPGVDDTIALLVAAALPEIDIVGISTVCGNVECDKTFANAKRIMSLAGKDVPIYKGADSPIMRELVTAKYVHGEDGLAGISSSLPDVTLTYEKEKPWDALYKEAKKYDGELVLVAVGPMTNVAIALAKYKELASMLKKIVIMGGSAAYGNITPAAEFNIYVDPEAAEILFKSDADIVMFGLDVTEKAIINQEEIEKIGAMKSEPAKVCHKLLNNTLGFYQKNGLDGICLHDVCTVVYLADPELFTGKKAGVRVETKGKITRGKTVCDMYVDVKFGFENAYVMTDVNREKFVEKIIEAIGRY